MKPLTVSGTLDSLGLIREHVRIAAAEAGLDRKRAYRLELAVDEVASNIVNHGYVENGMSGNIAICATLTPELLRIELEDTSPPFDPRVVERPEQIDLPLAQRPIGGLGVFLVMQYVDEYGYEYVNGRNLNTFVMRRQVD